jgi:integrase
METAPEFADFPEWPYTYRAIKVIKKGNKVEKRYNRIAVDTGTKIKGRQRQRFYFRDKTEALKKARELARELKDAGRHNFLDPVLRHDALTARSLLDGRSVKESLTDIARYFLTVRYPEGGDITVHDLAKRFIEAKEANTNLSKIYLVSLHRVKVFGEAMYRPNANPKKDPIPLRCSEMNEELILNFLRAPERAHWKPETVRQHWRYIRTLFNWAVKQRWIAENPLKGKEQPVGNQEEPGILTLPQVRTLVQEAWALNDPKFLPYVVLAAWGGVRPHEISRLKWGDFRGNYQFIRIARKKAKSRRFRNVRLPHCAKAMLISHTIRWGPTAQDPIIKGDFPHFKKMFRGLARKCGCWPWPHDALRHTFASYFYSATEDIVQLQARLGHTAPSITLDHYAKMIDPVNKEWISFFTMYCDDLSKREMETVIAQCTTNGTALLDEDKLKRFM